VTRAAARISAWAAALAVQLLLVAPRAAEACAVCTGGRDDETRSAFLLTTLFMSVAPLALVGGFVWWLRRRFHKLAAEQRPVAPAAAVSRTASSR
jgi:hypothetical protein